MRAPGLTPSLTLQNCCCGPTKIALVTYETHPVTAFGLFTAQTTGAWLTSDMVFVAVVAMLNAGAFAALRQRPPPLRVHALVFSAIAWAIVMRACLVCSSPLSDLVSFMNCARYPGRGLATACMASSTIIGLSSTVTKDSLSRTLLGIGVNRRVLWLFFVVPSLAHSLVNSKARSARLMQSRYSEHAAPIRWVRLRLAILASSFVRTLTQNWYAREAEDTRLRGFSQPPRFLRSDPLRAGDLVLAIFAFGSLVAAFQL